MSDYTPTTEEVRDLFGDEGNFMGTHYLGDWDMRVAAFDRWLAAHDAEVRADEREKAAQRVIDTVGAHPRHMTEHDKALVAAARGGEQA